MNVEKLFNALASAASALDFVSAQAFLSEAAQAVVEEDARTLCAVKGHDVEANSYIEQRIGKAGLLRFYLCAEHTAGWQAQNALDIDQGKVRWLGGPIHEPESVVAALDAKVRTMDSRLTEANRTNADLRHRLEAIEGKPAVAATPGGNGGRN